MDIFGFFLGFFPKRFLSWGVKTLFASASSCQCKPPHFSSPAGLCPVNLDQPRSSGRTRFWLSCSACNSIARNSIAATRPRFDFIYTKSYGRRGLSFRYTKNVVRRRLDFIYTKNAARRRLNFIYTKNWVGKIMEKQQWFIQKIFRAARAHFLKNFFVR